MNTKYVSYYVCEITNKIFTQPNLNFCSKITKEINNEPQKLEKYFCFKILQVLNFIVSMDYRKYINNFELI